MPALTWFSLHHLIRLVARLLRCVLDLGQARSPKLLHRLAAPVTYPPEHMPLEWLKNPCTSNPNRGED
jgi:hypothetical protein